MQVPFSTRGQGGPVKWEDGAEGPGAIVKGCYWGILDAFWSMKSGKKAQYNRSSQGPTNISIPDFTIRARMEMTLRLSPPSQKPDGTSPMPPSPPAAPCTLSPACPYAPPSHNPRTRISSHSLSEALLAALPQCTQSKMCLEVREVSQG